MTSNYSDSRHIPNNQPKYRILIVASHPVQYAAPLFQRMAKHPQLDIRVAYCSLQGAEPGMDSEFGIQVSWDIPLLDGYPWQSLANHASQPGPGRFFGLINWELWPLIRTQNFDAILVLTGYAYASYWIALAAAKIQGCPLLLSTDAHEIAPRDQQSWKTPLKQWLLPHIYQLADKLIVLSSGSRQFLTGLGIAEDRIQLAPEVVDNDWWIAQAKQVSRAAVRQQWSVPEDAPVVLFCAKLQSWKRPQDLLRAFAQADVSDAYLVLAGEGPLRAELESEAEALHLVDRVKFLGFVNQSQLPSVYRAADLMVLPSDYEPFGLVVNEAMLCKCPVVVSDQVGARYDLVKPGQTGFIYPCQDVAALAGILQTILPDPERLQQLGDSAFQRIQTWSPQEYVDAVVSGIASSVGNKNAPSIHS